MTTKIVTPEQAAAKAFKVCRHNDADHRSTAGYIARQHMLIGGHALPEVDKALPAINKLLDSWFEARRKDPSFTPEAKPKRVKPSVKAAARFLEDVPESEAKPDEAPNQDSV